MLRKPIVFSVGAFIALLGCTSDWQSDKVATSGHRAAIRTCSGSSPPEPIEAGWTQARANRHNPRPSGFNYAAPWLVAQWDPCTGTPPTLEVDWLKATAVTTGGRYTLYETAAGKHGLYSASELCYHRSGTGWFGDCLTGIPVSPGDIAQFSPEGTCGGRRIVHPFIEERLSVPSDVTDLIVEAKVRVAGNFKVFVGYDWWQSKTSNAKLWDFTCYGQSSPPTMGNCEGSFSDWASPVCSGDWMIIRSWDPGTHAGTIETDLGAVPPTPPSDRMTVDFTVMASATPVDDLAVYRKNTGAGIWEPLSVTSTGGASYRTEITTFRPSADVLVMAWKSAGVPHWGCERSGGINKLTLSAVGTDATGRRYTAVPNPEGLGCDVSFAPATAPPTAPLSPTVSVSPSSSPKGTIFQEPGYGFTPGGSVTQYFQKPSGLGSTGTKTADGSGAFSHAYDSSLVDEYGTFRYWAVDNATGKTSNIATFQITR